MKPLAEFARKYGKVCQPYCRPCQALYKQEHYAKNKQKYVDGARRRREALLVEVRELKKQPCTDCGQCFPYYVMDFDHREGEKKTGMIHDLIVHGCSCEVLMVEIAKCDLVCANCHRGRTHQRLMAANASEMLL